MRDAQPVPALPLGPPSTESTAVASQPHSMPEDPSTPIGRLVAWRDRVTRRLAPYVADEPLAGTFRAKQVQAVLRLTPLTMLANIFNGAIIFYAFWDSHSRPLIAVWFLVILLVATRGVRAWKAQRASVPRLAVSRRTLRRMTIHSAVLAGLWAVITLGLFSEADSAQRLLLAVIITGMICAGGFALVTVPLAGTVFVVVLTGASAWTIFSTEFPLAFVVGSLLLVYGFIVVSSVISMARSFGARLTAEAEAERQNEVIGLLLRDFEENTSDVLWEIDGRGFFGATSTRMVMALGMPTMHMADVPALDLLRTAQADSLPGERDQIAVLEEHMVQRAPFRDLVLRLLTKGRTHWWSLTAKPLFDRAGVCIGWRGVATNVTQTQLATVRLTYLAHFDPLTGLTNRHQFRAQLNTLLSAPREAHRACAILCLDLDNFKMVNDTLGHPMGDSLLQEVANRLRASTRPDDLVARLGGDEFAIILKQTDDPDEVAVAAQRVLDELHRPCEIQGASITVRSSVGVAIAPRDGTQIDQLLKNADLALYEAKATGRGSIRFFAPQMADQTRRRSLIEQSLRGALQRNELTLAFQPQINLRDWRVTGFEALLRWRHPVLGDVSPAEFIPVAEEAGMIIEIGNWVMHEACLRARSWPAPLHVAVNVSAAQVISQGLPSDIARVLAATQLPASRLEVEITESIFLHETQTTMAILRGIGALGVRVALDDFGTGYSSLAYLRRFPFHTLKIDRSFVRELVTRRDARAIVKTVVGLARTLKMATVAEGVDDPAQIDVLHRYGCDTVQGFFVSQALHADEVLPFLADWAARAVPPPEAPGTELLPLGQSGDSAYA